MTPIIVALCALLSVVTAVSGSGIISDESPPSIRLDSASITGTVLNGGALEGYLGIPYALPPTGTRRLALPTMVPAYQHDLNATEYGPYCPQEPEIIPGTPQNVTVPQSEDCLSINIIKPAKSANIKLPVVAWIFGGGFDQGGSADNHGDVIVQKSIDIGSPVIHVSFNHRINGLGFLASQEIVDAGLGNLGLLDQRLALSWIQKYIGVFGGDSEKVTLFGVSSGGISTSLQMLINNGNTEGLFRAAFMESGAPIPVGSYTHGQKYYDAIVQKTGCANATDSLRCLRGVPIESFMAAVLEQPTKESYQSLPSAWIPRVDGLVLKDNPQKLVLVGSVAKIPFVTGSCDDEGTLFSLSSLNVTTDDEFRGYINEIYFPNASSSDIALVEALYPADPTKGSPFNTGNNNTLTPQYKRISAFQGDVVFQAPRRFFLQQRSSLQNTWSYVTKRDKLTSTLGARHGSDLENMYGNGTRTEMQDYLINLATHLDPNGATQIIWPKWTSNAPSMMTFLDGPNAATVTDDTYRVDAMKGMTTLSMKYPF